MCVIRERIKQGNHVLLSEILEQSSNKVVVEPRGGTFNDARLKIDGLS